MRFRGFLRSTSMLSGVVGAAFMGVLTAQAADIPVKAQYAPPPSLPAVDGVNYKGELFGGLLSREGIGGVAGSVAMPLGHSYGLQFDGTLASYDGRFLGSAGAHLFWRDPSQGLLGIYGAHTYYDRFGGVSVNHVAAEFEHYNGRWTLQGIAGVEFGNSGSGIVPPNLVFTYDVSTRFFDQINLNYYTSDNSKLTIGHHYLGGKHALALGAEWARPLSQGTLGSFYIEGRLGEDKHHAVWAGLRLYRGNSDKTLIRRNREDDPINWSPDTLFGIVNQGGSSCPPNTFWTGTFCEFLEP